MDWSEVMEIKALNDLPFKFETNEWGNIVMSPASNQHSFFQGMIVRLLNEIKSDGFVFPECSIQTSKGVKVADVIWASSDFFKVNKLNTPYLKAPELCIEIASPSNSLIELEEKRDLYLAKGAREYWICESSGQLSFFGHIGKMSTSELFDTFPINIASEFPFA